MIIAPVSLTRRHHRIQCSEKIAQGSGQAVPANTASQTSRRRRSGQVRSRGQAWPNIETLSRSIRPHRTGLSWVKSPQARPNMSQVGPDEAGSGRARSDRPRPVIGLAGLVMTLSVAVQAVVYFELALLLEHLLQSCRENTP